MCIVLFLTGGVVLVSAVGENRLQLCETRPGLHSADEAFQVVQVSVWTEGKQTNTTQTHLLSTPSYICPEFVYFCFCPTLTRLQSERTSRA